MTIRFSKTWKPLCIAIALSAAAFETGRGTAAVASKPEEIQRRSAWLKERFLDAKPQLPFSFIYDGKKSEELLAAWPKKTTTKKLDECRTQHTLVWTDPKTGLKIRCTAVEYADLPAVEWVLHLTL